MSGEHAIFIMPEHMMYSVSNIGSMTPSSVERNTGVMAILISMGELLVYRRFDVNVY